MQTKPIPYLLAALSLTAFVYVLAEKASPGAKKPIFYDDFEYDVSRSATDAEVPFKVHGWTDVKANNSHFRRGAGYLYTKFDPIRKSRVLVMESLPSTAPVPEGFRTSQTDYWLKIGGLPNSDLNTIPANVWFQFWTYATPESRFSRKNKVLYPCRGSYPCSRRDGKTDFVWLFGWGSAHGEEEAPPGGRYFQFFAWHADFRGDREYPTNKQKLFQNMRKLPLLAGRWYQVKLHIDTSKEQGVYEAWIREKDQPWIKVAEWIGGVTKDFFWPIPANERVGNRVLAMPTTVNGPGDNVVYMDDFVMATSEQDMP